MESEAELSRASELLSVAERKAGVVEGSIGLWSMIETAKGLCHVEAICEADARVTGAIFRCGRLRG